MHLGLQRPPVLPSCGCHRSEWVEMATDYPRLVNPADIESDEDRLLHRLLYAAGDEAFPAALCSPHHNTVPVREYAQMGTVH